MIPMIETPRQMQRIDVTRKVYGKFDQQAMNLFMDKERIGRILFSDQGNQYEFLEGFEMEQNKIYHYEQVIEQNGRYVEDCDLGWC